MLMGEMGVNLRCVLLLVITTCGWDYSTFCDKHVPPFIPLPLSFLLPSPLHLLCFPSLSLSFSILDDPPWPNFFTA
jgi:hypothetical protein